MLVAAGLITLAALVVVAIGFLLAPFVVLVARNWRLFWILSAIVWLAIAAAVVRWPDLVVFVFLSALSFSGCLAIQARKPADR